jgi:integrase
MATVTIQERQRQGFKSYVVNFKDPQTGNKKYYKTYRKKTEASRAANDLRALLDTGKLPSKARKFSLRSFKEVTGGMVALWENKLREGELSPVTAKEYIRLAQRLEGFFATRFLIEISEKEIREYRNRVADESSNVNANRQFFVLKQIFKHGVELGTIQEDPTASIRNLSEKKHERKSFLMPDELHTLIEAAQQSKAKYYLPALICLGAEHGASKQEVLSLRIEDLDLEYDGKGLIYFYRTKNGMDRTQVLMPRTREYLRSWIEHVDWMRHRKKITPISTKYVFTHLDGSPIQNFSKAWRETCRLAGLNDFHFHDLRHTYCSNLRLIGADLHDVKEMIAHSDLAMTDRYAHIVGKRIFSLQQQLAEHYQAAYKEEVQGTHRVHLA